MDSPNCNCSAEWDSAVSPIGNRQTSTWLLVLRRTLSPAIPALLLFTLCSCGPKQAITEPETKQPVGATGAAATNARPDPAFEKLIGRWQRPDGGYVLEISSVEPGGKLNAAYFNPGPIHVSRAMVLKEEGTTKVFLELRDTGYPGCTYSLKYDPQVDQLYGNYFQAAMQETFDVTFARLKSE